MKTSIADAIITILKRPTRRPKTVKLFSVYRTGMSLAEFFKAGGTAIQVNYDRAHGFVQLADPDTKAVVTSKVRAADLKPAKVVAPRLAKGKKSDPTNYELRKLKAPKPPKKSSSARSGKKSTKRPSKKAS